MKRSTFFTLALLIAVLGLAPSAPAQTQTQTQTGQLEDESTRLMQEYMARREEWLAVRRDAHDRAAKASDEAARKQISDKLAEDEKPLLSRMAEAARAYQAAKKAKQPPAAPPAPTG